MNEGTDTRRQRNGRVGGVGGLARVTPTYVGSRKAEIDAMLATLNAGQPDRPTDTPAPGAGTLSAVADDPDCFNLQVCVPGADADGVDLDVMEHKRQNRLRSWQQPADKATGRF